MDIKADLTVAQADAEKIAAKLRADAAKAETEVSWIKANWHYALAIAVGFLILGVAFGLHFVKK